MLAVVDAALHVDSALVGSRSVGDDDASLDNVDAGRPGTYS